MKHLMEPAVRKMVSTTIYSNAATHARIILYQTTNHKNHRAVIVDDASLQHVFRGCDGEILKDEQNMSPTIMFATIRTRRRAFPFYVHCRYFRNSIGKADNSVTIGDVTVNHPPRGDLPHLIPDLLRLSGFHEVNASLPPCHVSHLRWMMQKDLVLGQDFLLLGTPNLARER
jgi:hypothetical protein